MSNRLICCVDPWYWFDVNQELSLVLVSEIRFSSRADAKSKLLFNNSHVKMSFSAEEINLIFFWRTKLFPSVQIYDNSRYQGWF